MKRGLIIVIIIVLLVVVGAGAYFSGMLDPMLGSGESAAAVDDGENAGTSSAGTTAESAPPQASVRTLSANARVIPARTSKLSLSVSGVVDEIYVAEGDEVAEGDLLLRLEDASQRTTLARTQAELKRAQANLDKLIAGARSEEIATAEAALTAALARLARLQNGALPGDMAVAEAGVDSAQAGLAKVLEGASDQSLIAAKADLANAQAELTRAQRAYNEIGWRNDVGAMPQSAQLQVATNNFEAAQARLADLQSGASRADVAGAQAQIRQAEANLERIENTYPADIAAAQADVDQAEAQLELLKAGARTEEIASAEADVAAATAAVQQALIDLANTELRAQFDSTVAMLETEIGEQVNAGNPVVQLADLNNWEIRTEDLTEFDVTGIQPGAAATLFFDAIPDLELDGIVERIRPMGSDQRGDIVYTVVIRPLGNDERLRWNMTAVASFDDLGEE